MTYLDKYPNCIKCPVSKWCGTAVSSIRLCHSYNDDVADKETSHVLTLSEAASNVNEEEFIEGRLEVWDNITD